MVERRSECFWKTHRKGILKAYFWMTLILIGLALTVFCSWNDNKIHLIPPEEPESISSDVLWNNAGSDMTTRIIYKQEQATVSSILKLFDKIRMSFYDTSRSR